MLYGAAVFNFTQGMSTRLNQAQHQLFKRILGLPRTAADEAVYLLTGIIPLSSQVDLEKLLLIGQMLVLPHDRFEYRTFLHFFTPCPSEQPPSNPGNLSLGSTVYQTSMP